MILLQQELGERQWRQRVRLQRQEMGRMGLSGEREEKGDHHFFISWFD